MVGRNILHYEVTAQLGSGGFGRVFLALDQRLGRKVALKFFDAAPPEAENRPRDLEREIRAAARLNHPGIVAVLALESYEEEWFIVEEYVEGQDLRRRLALGPLGDLELVRLARELASALDHAHGRGVLHRDIKPENVLIAASGDYKLTDFGVSRITDSSRSDSATLLGTLPYMAPERIRGHSGDARADLFSLGVVLYEAMSGQCPFAAHSEAEIVYAVLNRSPEPLAPRSGDARRVAEAAQWLLAKEPRDRPLDAALLTRWLSEDREDGASRPRRRRMPWAVASVGVAALTSVVIAFWPPRMEEGPIAVVEFRNVADAGDPSRLGLITSSLLTSNLANSVDRGVLSAERVLEAAQDIGPRELADRSTVVRRIARSTRAAWVVTGSILRTEPTLLMTAELSEAKTGRIREAVRLESPPRESVFDLTDRVGRQLALKLMRSTPPETLGGPRRRSTRDLIAYQRYVEGLEYLSLGEFAKAEVVFSAALKRDPSFELAREQLGVARWHQTSPHDREDR